MTLTFGKQLGEAMRRRWHIRPSAVLVIQLVLGVYAGALLGRRATPQAIRAGTLLIASGITLLFFVRTYVKLNPPHPFGP